MAAITSANFPIRNCRMAVLNLLGESRAVADDLNKMAASLDSALHIGVHGFGNGEEAKPWRKVGYGRDKFAGIVARHRTIHSKEQLIEELLELLADDTRLLPDAQIERQGKGRPASVLQAINAINVRAPDEKYGTRTNTLILVDGRGDVDFIERTMQEPIDADDPKWILTRHHFALAKREQ